MKLDVDIRGVKELNKALSGLGAELGLKTLRSALMASAKPMVDDMKEKVSVDHGGLRKSIGKRSRVDRKGKYAPVVVNVGAVRKNAAWRAHFVEFGVPERGIKAQPFIRPALSKSNEVVELFRVMLAKKIELARKKLNKK